MDGFFCTIQTSSCATDSDWEWRVQEYNAIDSFQVAETII